MKSLPLRLEPNADLRVALTSALAESGCHAAYVIGGIGSLSRVCLRYAGAEEAHPLVGSFEILTLSGTISRDGAHLHMSLADTSGRVLGGHVGSDCIVRTTAEIVILLLPEWEFRRRYDPNTGYDELAILASGAGHT